MSTQPVIQINLNWETVAFPLFILTVVAVHRLFFASQKNTQSANTATLRKRLATYQAPFPNGWYRVADSSELKKGQLKHVEALGQNLAVFRGEDGVAYVTDAICPHLGANVAVGGHVEGDCVVCPFHLWKFCGSDGNCNEIPYSDAKIPSVARLKPFHTREYYGMVVIWFHADGIDPTYEPLKLDMMENCVYRGRYDEDCIRMHIQEFAENSTDYAHFEPLHGQMKIPFTNLDIPGLKIIHKPDWIPDEKEGHIVRFVNHASLNLCGWDIPNADADATVTLMGPGGIVYFEFDIPHMGKIIMFQCHLPLEPLKQHVSFRWYAEPHIPRLLVYYVVGNWISQWRQDLMVWENKVFANTPVLVKGDGPMKRLRGWYSQFYSEGSAKVLPMDLDW